MKPLFNKRGIQLFYITSLMQRNKGMFLEQTICSSLAGIVRIDIDIISIENQTVRFLDLKLKSYIKNTNDS